MIVVTFTVPGKPVGKGRAKAARRGNFVQMYTPEKTVNYESLVALSAQQEMIGAPLTGPVAVELDIRLAIPKSYSKKKRSAALNGVLMPTKKPDIDNIEKSIFDGMNGVVWVDDVQVVDVSKRKRYSDMPGVTVTVREILAESA